MTLTSLYAEKSHPNILFIAIDDMNDWTTLFDENNPIKTPNLQRLAKRGTFFDRAYCAAPACCPSRAAVMTGIAPHKSKVYANGDAWAKLTPYAEVIPRHFKHQAGYQTQGGGKIYHHGGTGKAPKDKPTFDHYNRMKLLYGKQKSNLNGFGPSDAPLNKPFYDWGEFQGDKQNDDFTIEWAGSVMKKTWDNNASPQFLAVGIFRPHLPFWAPKRHFAHYPADENLVMPPLPQDDMTDVPKAGYRMTLKERFFQDKTRKQLDFSLGSDEQLIRCYQAASSYADEKVGELLDHLDSTGQADNTIIVLWSDHGYHLGDKDCFVKFTLWEKANHVPFIIVAPGVTTPGTRCSNPVSLLDIYPTLIDLAGLSKPDYTLDGVSLVPLLKDVNAKWDRPALSTYKEGNHTIRTPEFRYIRYNNGEEELYSDNDPWNHHNLVKKPEMLPVLKEHRKKLQDMLK